MKKEKSKSKSDKDVQRAIDAARKRWEFSLIKTGNIAATYSVGNVGKGKKARNAPLSLFGNQTALAAVDAAGVITNQPVRVKRQLVEDSVMIGKIDPSFDYQQTAFVIQAGDSTTFPWLSQVARLYERYQFADLQFEFRPLVSGFAEAGKQGRVTLYTNYDVLEPLATTMVIAESIDPHVSGIAKNIMRLNLDPKRLNSSPLFVRGNAVPGFSDAKTYDAGKFSVATEGFSLDATGSIGEVWVHYKCYCINPRLNEAIPPIPAYSAANGRFAVWQTGLINAPSGGWYDVIDENFTSFHKKQDGGLNVGELSDYGGYLPQIAQSNVRYTLTMSTFPTDEPDTVPSILVARGAYLNGTETISGTPNPGNIRGESIDVSLAVGRRGASYSSCTIELYVTNLPGTTPFNYQFLRAHTGWDNIAGASTKCLVAYTLVMEYLNPTTYAPLPGPTVVVAKTAKTKAK